MATANRKDEEEKKNVIVSAWRWMGRVAEMSCPLSEWIQVTQPSTNKHWGRKNTEEIQKDRIKIKMNEKKRKTTRKKKRNERHWSNEIIYTIIQMEQNNNKKKENFEPKTNSKRQMQVAKEFFEMQRQKMKSTIARKLRE